MWEIRDNAFFNSDITSELMPNLRFVGEENANIVEAMVKCVYGEELISGKSLTVIRLTNEGLSNISELISHKVSPTTSTIGVINIDTGAYFEEPEEYINKFFKEVEEVVVDEYELCGEYCDILKTTNHAWALLKHKNIESNYCWIINEPAYTEAEVELAALFPWCLEWLKPISEIASNKIGKRVIESAFKKDRETFQECVEQMSSDLGFKTILLKREISNFENQLYIAQREENKRIIDSYRADYETYCRHAREALEAVRKYELIRLGFAKIKPDNKLAENFASFQNIEFVSANSRALVFNVLQEISVFDTDIYNTYKENKYDNYLSDEYDGMDGEDLELLTDALFDDRRFSIITRAQVTLQSNGRVSGGEIPSPIIGKYRNAIPHPHIVKHNCWGGWFHHICDAFNDSDFCEALNIITAACSNFNVTDTTVGEELWRTLASFDGKFIKDNISGEILSPIEAIAKLKEERHVETIESD